MTELLWIAAGGGLGAGVRLYVSHAAARLCPDFPLGTLLVNAAGSLGMGLLAGLSLGSVPVSPLMQQHIGTGFLGALTTFSTFSMESFRLLQVGHRLRAFWNITLNMGMALGGVALGVLLGGVWL